VDKAATMLREIGVVAPERWVAMVLPSKRRLLAA
jgi:hypothetical protein